MVEAGAINILEASFLAPVKALGELNRRVVARAKIQRADLATGQRRATDALHCAGGLALGLLGLALRRATLDLA